MSLPKISHQINEIEFKSLGKKFKFRPILVKEEKLLLIAKQSESENDIFTTIKQVVNNCSLDSKFDVDKIPLFELEFAFLTLRIQSIGNILELSYHDSEDNKEYKFKINIEDIKIVYPKGEKVDGKVELPGGVGMVLRYPPASLYSNKDFLEAPNASASFDEILYESIEKIFDEDTVYDLSLEGRKEVEEFLESIDSSSYRKVQEFFENIPYMEYLIEYTNSKGTERKIVLRTLNDFFIL